MTEDLELKNRQLTSALANYETKVNELERKLQEAQGAFKMSDWDKGYEAGWNAHAHSWEGDCIEDCKKLALKLAATTEDRDLWKKSEGECLSDNQRLTVENEELRAKLAEAQEAFKMKQEAVLDATAETARVVYQRDELERKLADAEAKLKALNGAGSEQ